MEESEEREIKEPETVPIDDQTQERLDELIETQKQVQQQIQLIQEVYRNSKGISDEYELTRTPDGFVFAKQEE